MFSLLSVSRQKRNHKINPQDTAFAMEDGDAYRLPISSSDCLMASPTPSPSALGRSGCLGMRRLGYNKQVPIYTGIGIPARSRGLKFANHKDGDQPLAKRVIPAFVL